MPVIHGRYAPWSHVGSIPWSARRQDRPRPAQRRFDESTADGDTRDWSPERVADAETRWRSGEQTPYVERGHNEWVKREQSRAAQRAARPPVPNAVIDKAPVTAHIAALMEAGMTSEQIRKAGGIKKDTWRRALKPEVKRMTASTAGAILAVQAPATLTLAS